MSVAALGATVDLGPREAAVVAPAELSPRTRVLLHGPIVPTLLRMAWPNVLVMVAQAATGLIETWFVSKLGTDALAGMALVFPGVMLMQMISAGAMGGGISSAIARALGRGRRDQADALAMHAVIIHVALGALFSGIMLGFGRPIYLSRARRRGRRTRRGCDLFERGVCGQRAALVAQRLGEHHPRHRQYARPGIGDLRRCRGAGAAVAVADLRHRPVPGARHCRRGRGARLVLRRRHRGARLVHPIRPQHRALAAHASALAAVP